MIFWKALKNIFRGLLVGRLEQLCDLIGRNFWKFWYLILSATERVEQVDASFVFGATKASLQSLNAERHLIQFYLCQSASSSSRSDRFDAGYIFCVIRSHSGVGSEDMTPRENFGAILVSYIVTIAHGHRC
jgi:hypothetical protein